MDAGKEPAFTVLEGGVGNELASDAAVEAGLKDAERRLDRVLRMVSAGAVSFDASAPEPERELMGALQSIGQESVSFSAESGQAESPEAAGSKVERFLEKILERIGDFALIETRAGGQLVASTKVGMTGDLTCALGAMGAAEGHEIPADFSEHLKSLDRALRTRRAWIRVLLCTAQVAAKIALATGTGNPLLALPAAWKFIRGVMAEWKQLDQAA